MAHYPTITRPRPIRRALRRDRVSTVFPADAARHPSPFATRVLAQAQKSKNKQTTLPLFPWTDQ